MKKTICFDLDNVICKTFKNNYKKSKPNQKAIKKINILYESGYFIKIFTARYMGRNNDNKTKATKQGHSLTKKQLFKWKVKYHKLIFGKPSYDLFIDDKSIFFNENWVTKIDKFL
jgi:hypothetical protein